MVGLASEKSEVVFPATLICNGRSQVYLAHHLLAYVEMLRAGINSGFKECWERVNVCPLGSGALAGTTLPLGPGTGRQAARLRR